MPFARAVTAALRRNAKLLHNMLRQRAEKKRKLKDTAKERRPSSRVTQYRRIDMEAGLLEEITENNPDETTIKRKLWVWERK